MHHFESSGASPAQFDLDAIEGLGELADTPLFTPAFSGAGIVPAFQPLSGPFGTGTAQSITPIASALPPRKSSERRTKRFLEESAAYLQPENPTTKSQDTEARSGSSDKARERNKKAQRTFRQRQKAKAVQQDEDLSVATARILELQDQVAALQKILTADLGPAEELSQQSSSSGDTSITARIHASRAALQLEHSLLAVKELNILDLYDQHQVDIPSSEANSSLSTSLEVLARTDPIVARTSAMMTRKQHLQVDTSLF